MQTYFIHCQVLLPMAGSFTIPSLRAKLQGPRQRLSVTCIPRQAFPNKYTDTHAHAHAHSHIHQHPDTHACICTHAHMDRNTYTHARTHDHTQMHAHIHTHSEEAKSFSFIKGGISPQMYHLEINGPTWLHISQFQITRPQQDPLLSQT